MASMQRRTAKPGSVGSRHKAAASRLRSLQDVIGQHCPRVANICSMIGKSRCCSEYSVLNLLLSISGANLGPGTVISVSPLHTWQINGIRHWTCTAAPSNSNKSGAYAFFESCQSEAEAALQNRGFQVFRDGTKIGLIDPSRNAEAMFKHLSMRHDYTGLSLMEEGKKLVDQLACTKGPGAGLSADFRANLLTQRDGSRIAMATQSEPNRQIPYSNRTIAMMIQTEAHSLIRTCGQLWSLWLLTTGWRCIAQSYWVYAECHSHQHCSLQSRKLLKKTMMMMTFVLHGMELLMKVMVMMRKKVMMIVTARRIQRKKTQKQGSLY